MLQRRVRTGRWTKPFAGVYTVAGSPPTWHQRVWCAFLAVGPDAVISHESALHLHGVHELQAEPITITVRHGGHARLAGVFVHQIDDLRPHRVTRVAGLPTSRLERTLIELAGTSLSQQRLGALMDDAITAKKTTYAALGGCFREVLRPGKPGMVKLAQVLEARGDGYVPPQSELERALFEALALGGLPEPVRQFPLPSRSLVKGVVDAAYPDTRVIIEADGRRWHARIDQLKRDHQRDTEAARAGWLTLRFVYEQVVHEPVEVSAAIADVLTTRRASPPNESRR